ncbi:hypothetical protein [Xanthomonas sp. 3058]|uniref:hypothetical protein n=1 Tax=Xanthomonas sp. 3058 TaxID=3035314 RepID=UPI00160C2406|nr:hypothetical protein [Xanthomonas sp. 3058]
MRISARALPQATLLDKKFSAGGQAADPAGRADSSTRHRGRRCRVYLYRRRKTAQKKWFFESAVMRAHALLAWVRQRAARLARLDTPHRDARPKKNCKRVLTVKKSVIRFRPADIAAKESEQNRHQADKLVPDVHRSAISGGVGFASLQESSRPFDHAPVSPFDAGVSVSVPSRIPCGRFPTTARRCGVWFNWAFQLHSSLTRSQLHGH